MTAPNARALVSEGAGPEDAGNSDCPSPSDLEQALLGLLPNGQIGRIQAHLLQCESCVQLAGTLKAEDQLVAVMRDRRPAENDPEHDQRGIEQVIEYVTPARSNSASAAMASTFVSSKLGDDASAASRSNSGNASEGSDPFAIGPPPAASASFGRFRILRLHAKGGLGQVSVALDQELHREVALKEIRPEHTHHNGIRERFVLEAEITGGLEHPGIVPVYALGRAPDGSPFYAMRFVKGDSLKQVIDVFRDPHNPNRKDLGARHLALRQLLGRFVDVCNALEYAHSRGVLHRDLKPSNIMVGKYGETLVVDWGLAKALGKKDVVTEEVTLRPTTALSSSGQTRHGSAIGTPAYMSPEQAAGKLDELGPATDVYSLGATLYHILTGFPPFDKGDVGAILRNVQSGDFPKPRQRLSDVPLPLEAICLKAMAFNSAERYPSAQALATDVEHWLADEPVNAYRPPMNERLVRWWRGHVAIVTIAIVLMSSAALCGGPVLIFTANWKAVRRIINEEFQHNTRSLLPLLTSAVRDPEAVLLATDSLSLSAPEATQAAAISYHRAQAYAALQRYANAESEIRKSIACQPENINARHLHGWILLAAKKPDDALSEFETVLAADIRVSGAWLGSAQCRIFLKQDNPALADLNKALQLDPLLLPAYYSRITLLERIGRHHEAAQDRRLVAFFNR